MEPIEKPTCQGCAFYAAEDGQPSGECRFNPPKIFIVEGANQLTGQRAMMAQPMFPRMAENSWCGQFQPPEFWQEPEEEPGDLFHPAMASASLAAGHIPTLDQAKRFTVTSEGDVSGNIIETKA